MKILSIVWYKVLPAAYGGQKGIANFNRYLSFYQPLVCVCSSNNEPSNAVNYTVLPVLPTGKSQFANPFIIKKIVGIAKKEKPTHIIAEHPYHGLSALLACRATGANMVVHSHNIESQRFREIGKWWWRILHAYEKWVHRRATLILFKTAIDKQYAVDHFGIDPNKGMIIPYGIEKPSPINKTEARQTIQKRHNISAADKIVLFAGTLDYEPNARAVENIYKEIAPRLAEKNQLFKIIVCGRNRFSAFQYLKKLDHPSIIQADEVDNIDEYFAAADIFIDPVQHTSGIQTKIIEAISHDCNVAAFEQVASRIPYIYDTGKVFVGQADDWEQFCMQIITAWNKFTFTHEIFFERYSVREFTKKVHERLKVSRDGRNGATAV